jgi:hypothetical protein
MLMLAALPGAAQFRSIRIWFTDVGCASCTESMSERIGRLRGVQSAKVDAKEGLLDIRLSEQNRVRLEQVRDLIEQDGTKAKRAVVQVSGDVSKANDVWILQPAGVSSTYEISGASLTAGQATLTGEVRDLHPTARLRIETTQ